MFSKNLGAVPIGNTNSSDKAGSGRGGLGQPEDISSLQEGQRWLCHRGHVTFVGIKDAGRKALSEDRQQTDILTIILDILGNQQEFKNNKNVINFFVSICIESLQAFRPVNLSLNLVAFQLYEALDVCKALVQLPITIMFIF